jgi:hypothetical protein
MYVQRILELLAYAARAKWEWLAMPLYFNELKFFLVVLRPAGDPVSDTFANY